MKMFSDCSGPCETCKTHYTATCLAGHGDDEYDHASPEWIEEHVYKKGYQDGMKDWQAHVMMVFQEAKETLPRPGWFPLTWARDEIVRRFNKGIR